MSEETSVILQHLAAFSWFIEHGEVTLTAGLAFCLNKDADAGQTFSDLIRQRTDLTEDDLPSPHRWQAEHVDDNRGRIDVAGLFGPDDMLAPVVLVEAKVSAAFAPQQASAYVVSQQRALAHAGAARGALVVLVPQVRVRDARQDVDADLERLGATAQGETWLVGGETPVTVTVISWDDALDRMLAAATSAEDDLKQLRGACRALRGADVAALTEADLAGGWRTRKDDLRLIIDRVTQEATAQLSLPLAPLQPKPLDGLEGGYRYLAPSDLPNLTVGMRIDEADPPLWVRWHRHARDLAAVESRLTRAGHAVQKNENGLWLPLQLEADTGSATRQISSLASQVVELYKTAVAWPEPV